MTEPDDKKTKQKGDIEESRSKEDVIKELKAMNASRDVKFKARGLTGGFWISVIIILFCIFSMIYSVIYSVFCMKNDYHIFFSCYPKIIIGTLTLILFLILALAIVNCIYCFMKRRENIFDVDDSYSEFLKFVYDSYKIEFDRAKSLKKENDDLKSRIELAQKKIWKMQIAQNSDNFYMKPFYDSIRKK